MKIKGKKISSAQTRYVVIPRGDGDIVLTINTITDFEHFHKLCPIPIAPKIKERGKAEVIDVTDKRYKKEVEEYAFKRLCWTLMKSLEDTTGLEWDAQEGPVEKGEDDENEYNGIIENNADSLHHVIHQLSESFSNAEMEFIMERFNEVQGLTNEKIKEATDSFLAGRDTEPED